jgi:hypothetical protein
MSLYYVRLNSNERGEVRIPNVGPGEYVLFYNLSASLNPALKGKVVNYDPAEPGVHYSNIHGNTTTTSSGYKTDSPANIVHISSSLGCHGLFVAKGSTFVGRDDNLILEGYLYADCVDLAMISSKGELLKVRVPSPGSAAVRIEINTEIRK